MPRGTGVGWWAGLVAPALLLALVWVEVVGYSRNVFAAHPDWVLGKRLQAAPCMGSDEAFMSRQLLHRNRLNLDAWHAFHEVELNRVFDLGRLAWTFRLGEAAYLHVLFDRTAGGFGGIRLSRNPEWPSRVYQADAEGRFVAHRPVPVGLDGSVHRAELIADEDEFELRLDGRPVGRWPRHRPPQQVVGFRGGAAPAWVDDVEAIDAEGGLVIRESFANPSPGVAAVAALAVLLLLAQAATAAATARRGGSWRSVLAWAVMLELTAATLAAAYLGFDWYYWSRIYPYPRGELWSAGRDAPLPPERWRQAVFGPRIVSAPSPPSGPLVEFLELTPGPHTAGTGLQIASGSSGAFEYEQVDDSLAAIRDWMRRGVAADCVRILLLGTSQTYGVGANFAADRIASRLQRALAERVGSSVCTINAGQPGSRSTELLARYRARLRLVDPDVVLVNLSNNDRPDGFADSVAGLADVTAADGARVVFVLEPNSTEGGLIGLERKHRAMRQVAEARGIPVIDLQAFLSDPEVRDSGLLWWDRVHLSSYGQSLAARHLVGPVADAVARAAAAPGPGQTGASP